MIAQASAEQSPVTVSGLVITLSESEPLRQETLNSIAAHDALTIGECEGAWLSAVLESPEPKQVHRWLDALPGVVHVDVVFVSVDSDTPTH